MKVHSIYCGLQSPNLTTVQARQLIEDLALAHFPGGHTIYEATGRWQGIQVVCDEPTLIVEVWEADDYGFNPPPIAEFSADYKNEARQESVAVLTSSPEIVFI